MGSSATQDQVVRISVTLVQLDAVVTDSAGRQVTELGPRDFEVLEDGRKQQITRLSYISTSEASSASPAPVRAAVDRRSPPEPVRPLAPGEVKRTIAVVIDDLRMSLDSIRPTQDALRKLVDQEMEPGDLVAIIRTSGGIGVLQQFTNDKRQLHAAIDAVRWLPAGSGGTGSVPAISTRGGRAGVGGQAMAAAELGGYDLARDFYLAPQTFRVLRHTVGGLRELPGRKAVILFSRGFVMLSSQVTPAASQRVGSQAARAETGTIWADQLNWREQLELLTDMANRASVVIYGIDPQGLQTISRFGSINDSLLGNGSILASDVTAADDLATNTFSIPAKIDARAAFFYASQDGLFHLASTTGGFAVANSNDLSRGMRRILSDQKGYYLIGYVPDDSTFKASGAGHPAPFHKITVKVKRAGFHVRSRSGFVGVATPERVAAGSTKLPLAAGGADANDLTSLLLSPFNSGDISVRLTPLFRNSAGMGSYVQSLVQLDAHGLTFKDEPDGSHKSVVDVAAVIFDDNGQVVDKAVQTENIRLAGETYNAALKQGVVIGINLPLKRPGAHQLRVAVRDVATERTGSARQFIEAPDIKSGRLAISGILLDGNQQDSVAGKSVEGNLLPAEAVESDKNAKEVIVSTDPAIRSFRRGKDTVVNFSLVVYNATINSATGLPELQIQMRLVKEGRQISISPPVMLKPADRADLKRIAARGSLRLTPDQEPGHYFLQVVVSDGLAKAKSRAVTGWSDFEIVDGEASPPRQ